MTCQSIETALKRHDDIIQLLISLGADINMGIRANYHCSTGEEKKCSILDWVNVAIKSLETRIKGMIRQELTPVDFTQVQTWKDYAHLAVLVSGSWISRRTEEDRLADVERTEGIKRYFEDVKELLASNGAKTWSEMKGDESPSPSPGMPKRLGKTRDESSGTQKETPFESYDFVESGSSFSVSHLVPRYHELYEACFNGDNEKIQALCLPPEGVQIDETLLCITVQLRDPVAYYITGRSIAFIGTVVDFKVGVTPFSIAVERRKWDTARLILAIAVAQYEAKEAEVIFSVDDIHLGIFYPVQAPGYFIDNRCVDDDGSNNGSNCSNSSDATVEQGKNKNFYVDVAKRRSTVKCNTKPGIFFKYKRPYGSVSDGKCNEPTVFYVKETVFEVAIREDDLESFVELLDMFVNLPVPEDVPNDLLPLLLSKDRHEMLNELIRHTGTGIDLKTVRHEANDAIPANDQNKLYLGLNVHGKKRADLARKHDPNAKLETRDFPLLWRALHLCAEKVIDYLASERPYFAYRSYAMSHSDERAERLRSIDNLKELVPQWLGFRTNFFGESALTAAVLSGKVEPVKMLFAKHKDIMKALLHDKYATMCLDSGRIN